MLHQRDIRPEKLVRMTISGLSRTYSVLENSSTHVVGELPVVVNVSRVGSLTLATVPFFAFNGCQQRQESEEVRKLHDDWFSSE